MKMLTPGDVYCYARAAELFEQSHSGWGHCFKKAREEYSNLSNLVILPDYEDETFDEGETS